LGPWPDYAGKPIGGSSRGAEEESRGARGRRERGGPRGSFAKTEKSRDLTVNPGGSPAARGKLGKRFRSSRWSGGWPVLGKRGAEAVNRRRTGAGGGAPRDGDGVPVAGGQESGGDVARKLPWGDVVLIVCSAGVER
jgi:hypothetical protein